MGVDVFVHWNGSDPKELAENLNKIIPGRLELSMITNSGIKVWPDGFKENFCTDYWRCRFQPNENRKINKENIITLLTNALNENIYTTKTEDLYSFNGKAAFSLGQGQ